MPKTGTFLSFQQQQQKKAKTQAGANWHTKNEFKGPEGGQGYVTPKKFKARLIWARRVAVSDYIRKVVEVSNQTAVPAAASLSPINHANQVAT